MSREIRISIDDDEVFERMKARKRELDLSWEEVLHRGLRTRQRSDPNAGRPSADHGRRTEPVGGRGADSRAFGGRGEGRGIGGRGRRRHGNDSIGEFVDEFGTQLREHVQNQIRTSMESSLGSVGGLEREVSELEAAEDAVLRFECFPADRAETQVPHRVNLQTGPGGLDVDVVAVRQGKSVHEMNRFTREERAQINAELANGNGALLEFDGVETYQVVPVLSWTRDRDGRPTVADVDVERVVFDDER